MLSALSKGVAAVRNVAGPGGTLVRGSAWAVAVQGVLSATSFIVNLTLARNVSPTDYGVVVLAFGGIFLLQAVHYSLIVYPLSIRLATAAESQVPSLAMSSLALSLPLSVVLAAIAGAVALATRGNADTAVVVGCTVLASQFYETLRWILLSRLQHRRALVADGLRNGSAVLSIAWHAYHGNLTIHDAFVSLTAGAILGSCWLLWRTRVWRSSPDEIGILAADAWSIGRWNLVSGGIANVCVQILPWSLAAWHGPATTAQLQAVANLLGATHPVIFGLSNLVTPAVAQVAAFNDNVRYTVSRYTLIGAAALVPYLALLFFFPRTTLEIVYGSESQYTGAIAALRWFVVIYVFLYLLNIFNASLNGLRRSREVTFINSAGLVLQAVIGIPLAVKYGLVAACAGTCAAQILTSCVGLQVLHRATRVSEVPAETEDIPERKSADGVVAISESYRR